MTDNHILMGAQRQAELEAAKATFFATGGRATKLGSYCAIPVPARSTQIDPETVLVRKRRRPSPTDRAALRRMAEAL